MRIPVEERRDQLFPAECVTEHRKRSDIGQAGRDTFEKAVHGAGVLESKNIRKRAPSFAADVFRQIQTEGTDRVRKGREKFADGTVIALFFHFIRCDIFTYSIGALRFPVPVTYKFICNALAAGLSAGKLRIIPEIIGKRFLAAIKLRIHFKELPLIISLYPRKHGFRNIFDNAGKSEGFEILNRIGILNHRYPMGGDIIFPYGKLSDINGRFIKAAVPPDGILRFLLRRDIRKTHKAELRAVTLRHGTALRIHPGNIFPGFPDSMDAAERVPRRKQGDDGFPDNAGIIRMHMDEQRIKIPHDFLVIHSHQFTENAIDGDKRSGTVLEAEHGDTRGNAVYLRLEIFIRIFKTPARTRRLRYIRRIYSYRLPAPPQNLVAVNLKILIQARIINFLYVNFSVPHFRNGTPGTGLL